MSNSLTMNAIRQNSWGGPETLQLATVERPQPLPNEVLVRVIAAGVNPVDRYTREGQAYMSALTLPHIPGWDLSGVVEEVGYGVTRFKKGDDVFGMPWFPRQAGAYAEYVTAPTRHLALKPASLPHEQAAALPLAGLTTWQMLVEVANVEPGQRVLINGGAGGVGHLAIQVAKSQGAYVIATARAAKHAFLREMGADETVDYTQAPVEEQIDKVDVVIELIGGEVCLRMLRTLHPGGILVSAQAAWAPTLRQVARELGVRATWYLVESDSRGLELLAHLVDEGKLAVHLSACLPLASAAQAQEMLAGGRTTGKVVLHL